MIEAPLLDLIEGWKSLPHVVVHGDGMAPNIAAHSIVFFDPARRAMDCDAVYVVQLRPDFEPVPVRLQQWWDGKVGIIHDSRRHEPEKMERKELAPLILGRAVAHLRLL